MQIRDATRYIAVQFDIEADQCSMMQRSAYAVAHCKVELSGRCPKRDHPHIEAPTRDHGERQWIVHHNEGQSIRGDAHGPCEAYQGNDQHLGVALQQRSLS